MKKNRWSYSSGGLFFWVLGGGPGVHFPPFRVSLSFWGVCPSLQKKKGRGLLN